MEGLTGLVTKARDGDQSAWTSLVDGLKGVVWRVTASYDLAPHDRNDVFAATFFRLFEHLSDIREPEKLPGWLATTARNEVRQLLRARSRLDLRDDVNEDRSRHTSGDETAYLGQELLESELRVALRAAFDTLDEPCRQLLRLVSAVPPIGYDEIAAILGIPRGSIGPTRQRCLERLRRTRQLRPFLEGAPS